MHAATGPDRVSPPKSTSAILTPVPPRSPGGLRLARSIPSAVEALRANKGRSALTMLGIVIGVASVIVIVALGEGSSAQVNGQLAGLGANVLTISPGSSQSGGVRAGAGSVTTLKETDVEA